MIRASIILAALLASGTAGAETLLPGEQQYSLPDADYGDVTLNIRPPGARIYGANADPYYNAIPGDWCYRWRPAYHRYLEGCPERPTS